MREKIDSKEILKECVCDVYVMCVCDGYSEICSVWYVTQTFNFRKVLCRSRRLVAVLPLQLSHVPCLALTDSIELRLGSPLLTFLINLDLTEMPEAIPPLETRLHKAIGVD